MQSRERRADGVRPGPRRGRPASPPSRTARRLLAAGVWTTTSLGPPNCHTEQWSLPPSRTRSIPPAKSGLPLGRTRFLNSQRARVARHNPPRVIGKPGSLPSLCLLGGHVLWPRLRLVPAAAAAVAAAAAAVAELQLLPTHNTRHWTAGTQAWPDRNTSACATATTTPARPNSRPPPSPTEKCRAAVAEVERHRR